MKKGLVLGLVAFAIIGFLGVTSAIGADINLAKKINGGKDIEKRRTARRFRIRLCPV